VTKQIGKESNVRQQLAKGRISPIKTYMHLTVGSESFWFFLRYELLLFLLGFIPGAMGYFLRKVFYRNLFGSMGKGIIIGRNLTIRHPRKIFIGNNVTIDDNCVLDGRGSEKIGIEIGDDVLINRNCMLLAKNGPIQIGKRSSIGSNSVIVSMSGVEIGESVLTAGGVYLSAGSYQFGDLDRPIIDQETYSSGPIVIGNWSWIGTRVTILDGVSIGKGSVVGACSMVNSEIPPFAVAVGTPARVVRIRE
jgi:acetyltransferase-like isoleucine patch superfamily enzyme